MRVRFGLHLVLGLLAVLLVPFSYATPPVYHLAGEINLPTDMLLNNVKNPWRGKTLRLGILSDNTSPYNILIDNQFYGLNADYLSYVQQTSGIHFEVQGFTSVSLLLDALRKGDINALYGIPLNTLPEGVWASKPYYVSQLRVLRNRQNNRQIMVSSHDAEIAISKMTGMQALDHIRSLTPNVRLFSNNLQAIYSLLNGHSDYLIADEASASFILDQLQLGQIYQVESTALNFGSLSFVFASTDPLLLNVLNDTISTTPMEIMNTLQGRWDRPIPRYLDAGNATLTPMESDWVRQNPVIRYSANDSDYPFVYRGSDGQPHGYAIDILNIIAQNTGLQFQPVWSSNPQEADQQIDKGLAQFRAMLPLSSVAREHYDSTLPVHRALWGVFVRQNAPAVSTWQDLKGKRLGVLEGDLAAGLVPDGDTVQQYTDVTALYDALVKGQIDALVTNIVSGNFISLSRYSGQLKLAFAANNISYPISFGVSHHVPFLQSILNKNLQQIPPQTLQSLRDQWVSDRRNVIDAVNDNRMPPQTTWLLSVLGIIVMLLVVLLARRSYLQRKERKERKQIESARLHAEKANRDKSKFLATVSHELRTPMHAILGLLELETRRSMPSESHLPIIYSSAASLMHLLNDLQDYARLDAGSLTLSPKPMLLRPWLAQMSRLYSPLLGQRPVTLSVSTGGELPEVLMIDGDRLMQVINNLVGNAIKFTARGEIRVSVSWQPRQDENGELHLRVTDTGHGIEADEMGHLFAPYYRARNADEMSVQGSGLGLSVCKEIITKMQGSITLSSVSGVGTDVLVVLPATALKDVTLDAEPVTPWHPEGTVRVAVIDDHPTNLVLMQHQLASFGIKAEVFDEGRRFLRAHWQTPFDLLFIDYNMPSLNGVQLAKRVRRLERAPSKKATDIVLCSADVQEFTRLPALSGLVDHFLTKPISLSDITRVLSTQHVIAFADLPERINAMANHDQTFVRRLKDTLLLTLQEDQERLAVAYANRDLDDLEDAVHRFKGSLLILGYSIQAEACQAFIGQCRKGIIIDEAYNTTLQLLQDLLGRLSAH